MSGLLDGLDATPAEVAILDQVLAEADDDNGGHGPWNDQHNDGQHNTDQEDRDAAGPE